MLQKSVQDRPFFQSFRHLRKPGLLRNPVEWWRGTGTLLGPLLFLLAWSPVEATPALARPRAALRSAIGQRSAAQWWKAFGRMMTQWTPELPALSAPWSATKELRADGVRMLPRAHRKDATQQKERQQPARVTCVSCRGTVLAP